MKRRFQFSVVTLLAIVTMSAFASYWYATRHRVALAQDGLEAAMSGRDVGVSGDDEVYSASVRLLEAEKAMPFSNREQACTRHLELMERLENTWRGLPLITTSANPAEFRRECYDMADRAHVWVEEAQGWLDEAL